MQILTPPNDLIAQLVRSVGQIGVLISQVQPEQLSLPTPCPAWDVRALTAHVIEDIRFFTGVVNGETWEPREGDLPDADPVCAYRLAAGSLLAAWARPNVLQDTLHIPFGDVPAAWCAGQQISDLAVHAWDIARATGQRTDLDSEIGAFALGWGRANLHPEFRGGEGEAEFGREVSVPETAALYDRVAAFFGRDPEI